MENNGLSLPFPTVERINETGEKETVALPVTMEELTEAIKNKERG